MFLHFVDNKTILCKQLARRKSTEWIWRREIVLLLLLQLCYCLMKRRIFDYFFFVTKPCKEATRASSMNISHSLIVVFFVWIVYFVRQTLILSTDLRQTAVVSTFWMANGSLLFFERRMKKMSLGFLIKIWWREEKYLKLKCIWIGWGRLKC